MSLPAATFDVLVQIVLLEVQDRMELLNVQRDCERTLLVQRRQVRREHGEQLLARPLLHVERPTVADQRRHVHEAVVRRLVRDAVRVGAIRADAQPAEREHARRERAGMQLVEQLIERDPILDVGGVLDDQVRQGDSRRSLTYTRKSLDHRK